jgi:uncharacterized membrane protein
MNDQLVSKKPMNRILLALVVAILLQLLPPTVPGYAAPQRINVTQQMMDQLNTSGEAYLSSVSETNMLAVELVPTLQSLASTPLTMLSESAIQQSRDRAWQLAQQSALAIGTVNRLSNSMDAFGPSALGPIDVSATLSNGLPNEMKEELQQELGFSASNLVELDNALSEKEGILSDLQSSGLPSELEQQLLTSGFSTSELNQLVSTLRLRGVGQDGISTRLDQFRASRDNFASLRTHALMLYVQLLSRQIEHRQVQGIKPIAITGLETTELATDELRLLTHAAQLQTLWGNDPRLDIGEGHWWFIERYALAMANRVESLMLRTQNRELVVELLLAKQFHTLALTARAGDAHYVKGELDNLTELLSDLIGQSGFAAQARSTARYYKTADLRQIADQDQREQVYQIVPIHVQANVAYNISSRLAVSNGIVIESDEENNTASVQFVVGLPLLEMSSDVYNSAIDILSSSTTQDVLTWVKAILTGDTENPILMTANMILSVIPVIGAIPDIITLATDESMFMKAIALIGVIGSIGDVLVIFGVTAPAAAVSAFVDGAAAVIKVLYKGARAKIGHILDVVGFVKAFNIAKDFVGLLVKRAIKLGLDSAEGVGALISQLLEGSARLWDDFVALMQHADEALIDQVGIDEGSMLVGGVLRRRTEGGAEALSKEALRSVDTIAEDLAKNDILITDASADGLADLSENLGEDIAREFFKDCFSLKSVRKPQHFGNYTIIFASNYTQTSTTLTLCNSAVAEVYGKLARSEKGAFDKLFTVMEAQKAKEILNLIVDKYEIREDGLLTNIMTFKNIAKFIYYGLEGKDKITKVGPQFTRHLEDTINSITEEQMNNLFKYGTGNDGAFSALYPQLFIKNDIERSTIIDSIPEKSFLASPLINKLEENAAIWFSNRPNLPIANNRKFVAFGDEAFQAIFGTKSNAPDFLFASGGKYIATDIKQIDVEGSGPKVRDFLAQMKGVHEVLDMQNGFELEALEIVIPAGSKHRVAVKDQGYYDIEEISPNIYRMYQKGTKLDPALLIRHGDFDYTTTDITIPTYIYEVANP